MRSRWTIFWIFVLLAGVGFLIWQFAVRKEDGQRQESGQIVELPEGEKVNVSEDEIARWAEAFRRGEEVWRSDVVEVVKRERELLDITANPDVQIREHGEYVRKDEGPRRTLVFVLQPGLDIGAQKTVLLEEYPPGIWVPKEVGPFFIMVDRVAK